MTTAKQVPALVLAHQDFLRGYGYQEYAGNFFSSLMGRHMDGASVRDKFTKQEHVQAGISWCQWSADLLNISQLFHVSESMAEVAKIAAEHLSEDEVWTMEILPARNGVLVFEQPLEMSDVWNRIVTISAVQWTVTDNLLSLSQYSDVSTQVDHYNQIMQAQGILEKSRRMTGTWSLAHVESIKFGKKLGGFFTEDDPEVQAYRNTHQDTTDPKFTTDLLPATPGKRPLFGNLSNLLFSIWALMDQTITDLSEETDKRLARMSVKRKRPPPMVTVIQLRRKESHGYHEEGTGRWLNYCSMTRGHWRRQPYGPGRAMVRRIWVNPYIRGDPSLPFHQPRRVSTLSR